MSSILNPETFEQWLAVVAALASFAGVAVSAIWRAWTYAAEQRQKKWERLHELVQILHHGSEKGLWGQLAAVSELRTINVDRKVLAILVAKAVTHFKAVDADQELIQALADFHKELPQS